MFSVKLFFAVLVFVFLGFELAAQEGNQSGSATFRDTTEQNIQGVDISNPTQYRDESTAPPLLTAEAGEGDFQSNLPLLGLLGLAGLLGLRRKPAEVV